MEPRTSTASSRAILRHGEGVGPILRALGSQIHPVFMAPPLAIALFGAILAGRIHFAVATIHLVAIFAAVYTAHVKDGYVDFHRRGEDDDHPLTVFGCRLALVGAGSVFWIATVLLYFVAGPLAAALTAPGWVIGFLHAPQLDTTTIGATIGYPAGIALSLLGGYAAQTGGVGPTPVGLALTMLVVLIGVKIIDDGTDVQYDASIDKPTVPVVLGRRSARRLGFYAIGLGCLGILWMTVDGLVPPSSLVAPAIFLPVVVVATRADDETATMLLVRGLYLFLAALLVAVWYNPLAGQPLPDIAVFGPYTYLVTEVFFGSIALALLIHAAALRAAARTIALLYPLGYLWDWYTLTVGVFAIELRTGVDLFGIPIEEHLFILVVPAMVIGVHETLRTKKERPIPPPRREQDSSH